MLFVFPVKSISSNHYSTNVNVCAIISYIYSLVFVLFLQEVLASLGLFKLPAMVLMFAQQEGMGYHVDPTQPKPRDGEQVRAVLGGGAPVCRVT